MTGFDHEKWGAYLESADGTAALEKLVALITETPLAKNKYVSVLLKMMPHLSTFIPLIGTALAAFTTDFPGNSRAEIFQWFQNLSSKVDEVKVELERTVKWESVKVQYGSHITVIQLGMQHLQKIGAADGEDNRTFLRSRLAEFGSKQDVILAMNALLDGLSESDLFRTPILEEYYSQTGGHLPKLRNLVDHLLHLVYGGLVVMFTYETIRRGSVAAEELMNDYNKKVDSVQEIIQGFLDKCQKEFKINMMKDLDSVLDSGKSNEVAVNFLSALLKEKYDWLENYCIICEESVHVDFFCTGKYVKSSERNGKFGIICFRDISSSMISQERRDEIVAILQTFQREVNVISHSAADMCAEITEKIQEKPNVEVCACVVIRPKAALALVPLYSYNLYRNWSATVATLKEKDSCSTSCRHWLGDQGRQGYKRKGIYILVLLD